MVERSYSWGNAGRDAGGPWAMIFIPDDGGPCSMIFIPETRSFRDNPASWAQVFPRTTIIKQDLIIIRPHRNRPTGQAKMIIKDGLVIVDGEIETRIRRKIRHGMIIKYLAQSLKAV